MDTPAAIPGLDAAGSAKFVMCPPRFLSTRIANNVWMKSEKIDIPRALTQFARIKNVITALGTRVLEIPPHKACQDQTYTANVGVAIKPSIYLANYKAEGRACEVPIASKFFEGLGYRTLQPPYHFEGEADLKKWKQNVYFGGFGQFTDQRAHQWIAQKSGAQIIPLHETNPKVYHLDCCLLVVDEKNLLVVEDSLDKKSLDRLSSLANLVFVPPALLTTGCTNAVLLPEKHVCLSGTFNPEMPDYQKAMEWMNKTFDSFGYTCVFLDVDEFDKSGADLSCCVMHLDF